MSATRLRILALTLAIVSHGPLLATEWAMVPEKSTLAFIASQQGAEFRGQFDVFEAQIELDPGDPSAGRIVATVQTGSVNTMNPERDQYLLDSDWFHVAQWPTAIFETTRIEQTGEDAFVAGGHLTLRDATQPVTMVFTLDTQGEHLRLQGTVELARLDFGVGQGEWSSTEWVGNEVRVLIDLQLRPAGSASAALHP